MQELDTSLSTDSIVASQGTGFCLSEQAVGYLESVLAARISYCTKLEVMYAAMNTFLAIAVLGFVGWIGSIAFLTPGGSDLQKIGSAAVQTSVLTIAATICFRLLRVGIRTGNYWTCEKKTVAGVLTRIELYRRSNRPLEFVAVESWMDAYDRMRPDIDLSDTSFTLSNSGHSSSKGKSAPVHK